METAGHESTQMRLNHIPTDPSGPANPPGGQGDLASSPAEKKAAARAIEQHIEPDTKQAGAWTDEETGSAVKAFGPKDGHGWLTSGAVSKAHKAWGEQAQNLMSRLSSEKGALRSSNTALTGTDFGVLAGVRKVSVLDTYSPPPHP
ncbi:hypothetical protein ACFVY0_11805 [Streptomyces sp. NPDC058286]|uniref:hypothetical protein n=1 Tax=unclassified Streptomyces TaxID=2593676 RepID=UPI0036EEB524